MTTPRIGWSGLVAHNPAQRLSARFGRSGVAIEAGSARFGIALRAVGRVGALQPLAPVAPRQRANRVTYAHGPVHEWWQNGPIGLEQDFDLVRRPAGAGALAFSLAISGRVALDHGTLLLAGGLRYAGLRAAMPIIARCLRGLSSETAECSYASMIAERDTRSMWTRLSSRRNLPPATGPC